MRWQEYWADRPRDEPIRMLLALNTALKELRLASAVATEHGEMDDLRQAVRAAIEQLQLVRSLLDQR